MSVNERQPLEILLVDDDDVDAISVQRAFKKSNRHEELTRKRNGLEALNYLRSRSNQCSLIVILDLEMPMMNGFEFLKTLRKDSDLKSTVVFILTTSSCNQDIQKAYENYVSGYICKDNVGKNFERLMSLINGFGQVVSLPLSHIGDGYACSVN